MGVAILFPDTSSSPSTRDQNPGTYDAFFVTGGTNSSPLGAAYAFCYNRSRGYPADRVMQQMRLAATVYQAKSTVSCHFTDASGVLGSVFSGATSAYQTIYGAWVAPIAEESTSVTRTLQFVTDNRASGTTTEFRVIDYWVEVQYADYPAAPAITGGGSTTSTTFSMSCNLTVPATGQTVSAFFQLATDSGFSNVIYQVQTGFNGNGSYSAGTPVLGPGTYYYRAYTIDAYGQGSGWSSIATMTVSYPAPPAPTAVTPAAAATVTVPNPVFGATLNAAANGQTQRAEWVIATDSAFTTGVRYVTETTADLRVSGATTESPTLANLNLPNGTYYLLARAIDVYGQYSVNSSAGTTFTVNVAPPPVPTVVTPAAAATITTTNPTLGATLGAASNGRLSKAQWRLSKDNTFATGVITVIESDVDRRASGATTEPVPSSFKLTNGTWYIQASSIADDTSTSAWTTVQSFTVSLPAPPVPTALTPANASTVTTNTPTVGATLGAASDGRTSKAEFQFATDAGFTANVKQFAESDTDLRISGATTETVPVPSKLTQVLWYWRVRSVDQFGQFSAWSASQTLTPTHPPAASGLNPTGGTTLLYAATTPFSWVFSDPWSADSQRAYQIVIERNDTGAGVVDTGKVISTLSAVNVAVPVGQKDQPLRWKVQVWDQDDVGSGFSATSPFFVSDAPIITITSPTAGQLLGTGRPTITWTDDVQTTQVNYRVQIFQTSGNVLIYDSGVVASAVARADTPPNTVLVNLVNYYVKVTVTDNVGLVGTAQQNFTTSYQPPPTVNFIADGSTYPTLGYVNIDWSATTPDATWLGWRLYRRVLGATTWSLIKAFTDVNNRTWQDWTAQAGVTYEYSVTQLADRSGTTFESLAPTPPPQVLAYTENYWLINPTDNTKNLLLYNVTDDGYTDTVEQETYTVLGRGRRTDYGTDVGIAGSLTAQLRDRPNGGLTARQQKVALAALKRNGVTYYLRTPFGDLFQVSLGDVAVSRVAGVGTREFVDVTISYTQVF